MHCLCANNYNLPSRPFVFFIRRRPPGGGIFTIIHAKTRFRAPKVGLRQHLAQSRDDFQLQSSTPTIIPYPGLLRIACLYCFAC